MKLAVSGCILHISNMHSLLLLEMIFEGIGEITGFGNQDYMGNQDPRKAQS